MTSTSLRTSMRTCLLGLPRRKLSEVEKVLDSHREIPGRIGVLVRDLIRFRIPSHSLINSKNRFLFRMDMVNLPSLLHNKNVISAIPSGIDNNPPINIPVQLLVRSLTITKLSPI